MTDRVFTNDEKHEAIVREVKMRERVYPRWVAAGRMSQKKADYEIAVMRAIAEHFKPTGKLL